MRSLYPTDIVVVDRTKEKRTRETERERGKRMQYVLLFYQRTPVEAKSDRGKKREREREKKTLCVYIYISARYTLLSLYLHILDYYWYCCQSRWQQSMSRLKAFIQC